MKNKIDNIYKKIKEEEDIIERVLLNMELKYEFYLDTIKL